MSLSSSPGRLLSATSDITPGTRPLTSGKMSALDSVGSCSLGAYTSSCESTDLFPGTPKQRIESEIDRENGLFSHSNKLTSACTLCSISENHIHTGTSIAPQFNTTCDSVKYVRGAVILFEDQRQQLPEDTEPSSLPVVRKPSYLGISCSLSGYSSLTSYDSKVREGFRTRDKSPAPPHPRLLSNMPNKEVSNISNIRIESSSQLNCETPPLEGQKESSTLGTGISLKKQTSTVLGYENLSLSSATECSGAYRGGNTLHCPSKPVIGQMDETDCCNTSRRCNVSQNTSHELATVAMIAPSPLSSESTPFSRPSGAVRVTKFTCQTKSFIHTQVSSGEVQQETGSIENYEGEVKTNGIHVDRQNSEDAACITEECKTPKSFVQQRIERLYGPGALAQGFLSRVRKISASFDESPKQVATNAGIASSNPHLPVLRHLRPEFRAQLPLTCTPSSKLQRPLHNPGQSVPNVSPPDLESSITSLADSQPAAPDVPVIKAGTSLIPPEISNVDSQLIPVESRMSSCISEVYPSLNDNSAVEPRRTSTESVIEDPSFVKDEKNGHHFLKVLHKEIERLSDLADQAEHELYNVEYLSEDAQGKLRAASGQARLLTKQKLQQFEGLCNKNISQCPEEAFPTTAQDLEGFWDMVKLQIDHVDLLFSEIDFLRQHNWKDNTEQATNFGTINGSRRRQGTRHSTMKPASVPPLFAGTKVKVVSSTCDEKKNDSTRRSREEQSLARKKLMDERRQALKAQQAKPEQHVEIYVASRIGK